MSTFKNEHSFSDRIAESNRVLQKYPDRLPLICEKVSSSKIEQIDKKKYLVPRDLSFGQFIYVIRKRLRLRSEKAIFIFVNGIIPPCNAQINNYYFTNRDRDGFLYLTYSSENVFG